MDAKSRVHTLPDPDRPTRRVLPSPEHPVIKRVHQDVDRAEVTGNENELRLRTTKPEISESGATTIVVWTDGSCNANGIQGRGGWAALIEQAGTVREISGGADDTTQNRMELTAICEALETLTGVIRRLH